MATTNPIDEYLATLDEPKRATLTSLRDTIMAILPDAEQCISYGMPAWVCDKFVGDQDRLGVRAGQAVRV